MKNANQIRRLLKSIEWIHVAFYLDDFFCPSCKRSNEDGHYKDCQLKQALALLPCETCCGTGKSLEYAKACPECGCAEYVNENLLGENYRECKKCGQDWWLQVKYGIGNSPCPDCQPKLKQEKSSPSMMWEHLH